MQSTKLPKFSRGGFCLVKSRTQSHYGNSQSIQIRLPLAAKQIRLCAYQRVVFRKTTLNSRFVMTEL